jgi:hypothetical protein
MGKAKRKPRPSPPHHVWLDLDACWFCKNSNNCNQCKVMKKAVAVQKEKIIKQRAREEKRYYEKTV